VPPIFQKWLSTLCTTCGRVSYPSWTLGASVGGHDYKCSLQVLLPPTVVPVIQAGRWRGVSRGSRLQMAFKSSYYLQPCQLPKLDTGGALVGGHDYKWPSSPPSTSSRHKLDAGGVLVGGHDYKWPSSLLTICSRAGSPSWTLGGVSSCSLIDLHRLHYHSSLFDKQVIW